MAAYTTLIIALLPAAYILACKFFAEHQDKERVKDNEVTYYAGMLAGITVILFLGSIIGSLIWGSLHNKKENQKNSKNP